MQIVLQIFRNFFSKKIELASLIGNTHDNQGKKMTEENLDRLILSVSVREACTILSLGRTSLHKMCKNRVIESYKYGSRRFIIVDSLREFIANAPRTI